MDIRDPVQMVNLLKFKGGKGLVSYAEYAAHIAGWRKGEPVSSIRRCTV